MCRFLISAGLALTCVFIFPSSMRAESEQAYKDSATKVATSWVALLDQGRFGESWENAAKFFQTQVSKPAWSQTIKSVRTPLGKNLTRTLARASYEKSLPGVPDGHYVIVQFRSSFANKSQAIETITPMLDKDGKWRVSGYYIK